jgi:hypothetical protein
MDFCTWYNEALAVPRGGRVREQSPRHMEGTDLQSKSRSDNTVPLPGVTGHTDSSVSVEGRMQGCGSQVARLWAMVETG